MPSATLLGGRTMAKKIGMAQDMVRKYADENQWAVRKDIDALIECGEVDSETVWSGYLADAVFSNEDVAEIEEEVCTALVDFYCEQMED